MLQRYWRAWSTTPPPADLQHLINAVSADSPLELYCPSNKPPLEIPRAADRLAGAAHSADAGSVGSVRQEAAMGLYVNHGSKGWTELRVHGVSGTPPESSLGHPCVARVAGDERAGFYRREWETRRVSEDTKKFRRETYSWGGLTSGDNQRALWLLLLPFMLLNLAFFTDRGHQASDTTWHVAFRTVVQRLLAISLTGAYVLGGISASVDLVGWQCGNAALGRPAGAKACAGGTGWLRWLQYGWLDSPGRHLTVTAVFPIALIALLWYLGNKTWRVAEAQPVSQSPGTPDVRTPLEDRRMWNGRGPVRRLRALHIAGAFAITTVFILAPLVDPARRGLNALTDNNRWEAGTAFFRSLCLVVALVLLAFVIVMVALPGTARRIRPSAQDRVSSERDLYGFLPWGALVLVVGAGVAASWGSKGGENSAASQLPWEVAWIHVLFIAQAAMLVLLFVSQLLSRLLACPPATASSLKDLPRQPWGGFVLTGVALLSWALAGALASGLMMRTAEILGAPTVAQRWDKAAKQAQLIVPDAYFWTGTAVSLLVAVAIVIAVISWLAQRGARGHFAHEVDRVYRPTSGDPRRCKEIATSWALGQLIERRGQRGLGSFVLVAATVVVAGTIAFALDSKPVTDQQWLVLLSNLVLSAGFLGMLWAGKQAYRSPRFRRTVGILWDIGSFWPRETHPLAPPCYAERTIPDLLKRVEYLTANRGLLARKGHVILSCHSQGSVIGAALVLQTTTAADSRVRLLTYGCPLTHMFVRFFPAYFNASSLERIGTLLVAGAPDADADHWPWRNLYRLSDPIGSWVLAPAQLPKAGEPVNPVPPPVDRQLLDPSGFARQPGDPCYPATLGHSNYFADPAFDETVRAFCKGAIP
ncbi:hypothetical protein [Streptomyces natalensis]|nr:hypothetical protein [Streptomyces natalensis]